MMWTLLKSKLFWSAIIALVIGYFIINYTSIQKDLVEAYNDVQNLSKSLEVTQQSVDTLRTEMEKIDVYSTQQRENRQSIERELGKLREELVKEREQNENLNECWNVYHGNVFDKLRPPTTTD